MYKGSKNMEGKPTHPIALLCGWVGMLCANQLIVEVESAGRIFVYLMTILNCYQHRHFLVLV